MSGVKEKFVLEPERYEFHPAPIHQFDLARRDFFKILGAGIAVFAVAKDALAAQETAPGHRSFHMEELPKDINAWLHVGEDGTVTGFTGKAEIGQNIRTSLAQTCAWLPQTRRSRLLIWAHLAAVPLRRSLRSCGAWHGPRAICSLKQPRGNGILRQQD
jgi:CO/xanthine dehydrogenase Mo-binding subunit